jgi:plastocyanin
VKVRTYIVIVGLLLATAGAVYAAQHKVGQKGRLFNPSALTVKAGDELVFENDDDVTHHVYSSTKGQEFDLKPIAPGEKKPLTFAKPGRVDIRCGLHPGMRLMVTVE